jgi:hypothetical protein
LTGGYLGLPCILHVDLIIIQHVERKKWSTRQDDR